MTPGNVSPVLGSLRLCGCPTLLLWATMPLMVQLSKKETEILRFIRTSRHKTTVDQIARALALPDAEVEVFIRGMVGQKLINIASGTAGSADSFYTNPEKREEIYDLLG